MPEEGIAEIPECIQILLKEFTVVFQEPSSLPPFRDTDHRIHLKSDASPVMLDLIVTHIFRNQKWKNWCRKCCNKELLGLVTVPIPHLFSWLRKKMGHGGSVLIIEH